MTNERRDSSAPGRRLRELLAAAFSFVRSQEANQALATVTLEVLIQDQISRNGESARSNAAQYNPYGFNPAEPGAAGAEPTERANFLSGSDLRRPTKLDRVLAIRNQLTDAIESMKASEHDIGEWSASAEETVR